MSLLHNDSTLDAVLTAVVGRVPHCCGNCNGGRSDCTLPGVCSLPARIRTQCRAQTPAPAPTDAEDTLYTPGDARATRRLLITIVLAVAATLWLITP